MKLPRYEIIAMNAKGIILRDVGPWEDWPTVTNAAEVVVDELNKRLILSPGMRLFYVDSDGEPGEILLYDDMTFKGFRPMPENDPLANEALKVMAIH
jgi:hypothetical protein